MNDLDAAWLAGIIDGEGYLGIGPVRGPVRQKDGIRPSGINIKLDVEMNCRRTLRHIMEITGVGTLYQRRTRRAGRWATNTHGTVAVLRRCLPYLVTKRAQAQIVIECFEATAGRKRGHPISQAEMARYADYRAKLAEAKRASDSELDG